MNSRIESNIARIEVLSMNTEIIVAILAFVGTLAGSYFSNNKTTAVIQEQIKNIKEDISILSNRVDKHNK